MLFYQGLRHRLTAKALGPRLGKYFILNMFSSLRFIIIINYTFFSGAEVGLILPIIFSSGYSALDDYHGNYRIQQQTVSRFLGFTLNFHSM